jgi:Zn-dependent protease
VPVQKVTTNYKFDYKYRSPSLGKTRFWFSPTEARHLTISALLVTSVGLSWIFFLSTYSVAALIIAAFIFAFIFLSHEIAHKLVAQHYGLWAEFRLTLLGAIVTLLSIILPFKIVSPGAVMIRGYATKENVGKTAIAGPLVNIVLSIVSFSLTFVLFGPFIIVAVLSAALNAFIAVFNLIPFGMFDGLKVFNWSKLVWGISFIVSTALIIVIFTFYGWLL